MGAIQSTLGAVGKILPVQVSIGKKTSLQDYSEARDSTLVLDASQTRQAAEIEARAK
jgi:hypothetical protein